MGFELKSKSIRLVAKTLSGLEGVLAEELTALGASDVWPGNRAVEFAGDKRLLYNANLWCRTATRILMPIASFRAATSEQLYRHCSQIEWTNYLDVGGTLAVDAVAIDSAFDNSLFVAQRVKDAIVDQFRGRFGKRPSVDADNPDLRVNIHIHGDKATLSLDSSGQSLTRRGYRIGGGKAPLSEVLAAGIIKLTGWDKTAPLIDPMCGSGTIVIEAAMLAKNMAPGLLRKEYGFMRWKDYDPALWQSSVKKAKSAMVPEPAGEIVGSDIDSAVLREAEANAVRAGVKKQIRLERKSFAEQNPPQGPGFLVTNPPYGERIAVKEIDALYKMRGDNLKQKYNGYKAFVFTGNMGAIKAIGLKTSRRIKLFNGPIECRLLGFDIYQGSRKKKYDVGQNIDEN